MLISMELVLAYKFSILILYSNVVTWPIVKFMKFDDWKRSKRFSPIFES